MIVSWLSFTCFFIAALIHVGFFIYEFFIPRESAAVTVWAKNMGVYNLCLALSTFFGLYMIFKKQIMVAGYITSICGLTMIVAAVTLWFTAPKLRKFALLQGVPPLVGFGFLAMHIVERLGL